MAMELFPTDSAAVLGYLRQNDGNRLIVLANFSESDQEVSANRLRTVGLGRFFENLVTGETVATSAPIKLSPYQFMWLKRV
jgi:amylosucrase